MKIAAVFTASASSMEDSHPGQRFSDAIYARSSFGRAWTLGMRRAAAAVEAMHAQGPLIVDQTSFRDRQNPERKDENEGWPDHRM